MGIKSGDLDKMRAPLDFIGINLYYRTIASAPTALERLSHLQQWLFPAKMTGGRQGPKTDIGWEVWPQAMYEIITRISRDFNQADSRLPKAAVPTTTVPAQAMLLTIRGVSNITGSTCRRSPAPSPTAPTSAAIMPGPCSITSNGPKASASALALPTWISRRCGA